MKFEKGVSGNPGGRPKGLSAKLRKTYGEDADQLIAELHKFAFGKVKKCPHKVRLDAIKELLERGWGKAPQTVVGDPDAPPVQHRVLFGGRYRPDGAKS